MTSRRTRREIHFDGRIVRCFSDRPSSVLEIFDNATNAAPNRICIENEHNSISYSELHNLSFAGADFLKSRGVEFGDRVIVLLDNCVDYIISIFSCMRLGAIFVPVNTAVSKNELEFISSQCSAKAIIHHAAQHSLVNHGNNDVPVIICVNERITSLFDELNNEHPDTYINNFSISDSAVCILYTSGTTGKPKGAVLTNLGLVHSIIHYTDGAKLRKGDVAILAVPGSHAAGLIGVILPIIHVAGKIHMMKKFVADEFIRLAQQVSMTYTLIVPTMFNLLLLVEGRKKDDIPSWRVSAFGGASMLQATIDRMRQWLPNLAMVNVYGATETSSPATLLPVGDINIVPTSVGKVLPCADIIVIDEAGRELCEGESGELLIAGAIVVPEYWRNDDANKDCFIGGYWRSGDIGYIDKEGYVYILGRTKEVINRGGFKVYPLELEDIISSNESVREVAVFGVDDDIMGERIKAVVFAKDSNTNESVIREHCKKFLSKYKNPDFITISKEPLPRTHNGKIDKRMMKQG